MSFAQGRVRPLRSYCDDLRLPRLKVRKWATLMRIRFPASRWVLQRSLHQLADRTMLRPCVCFPCARADFPFGSARRGTRELVCTRLGHRRRRSGFKDLTGRPRCRKKYPPLRRTARLTPPTPMAALRPTRDADSVRCLKACAFRSAGPHSSVTTRGRAGRADTLATGSKLRSLTR